jgi:hypothetical protein
LGAEIGIAAGPYGSGGSVESGKEKAAVFSYIRSKGLYAGIEITGTVSDFVSVMGFELINRYSWSDSMRMGICTIGKGSKLVISYVMLH